MPKEKTKLKKNRKLVNKKLIGLGVTLIAGLVIFASASLFSVFVTHTETVNVEGYLFFDEQPMGDLITVGGFSMYPNETVQVMHWINYTALSADGGIPMNFTFSGEALDDGTLTAWMELDNTGLVITGLVLYPGDSVRVNCSYWCHPLAVPGDYDIELLVDYDDGL